MNLPRWVTDPALTDEQRQKALVTYQIKLAALHNCPSAALSRLGTDAGFSTMYMRNTIGKGRLSKRAQMAIQALVGPEVFDTGATTTNDI